MAVVSVTTAGRSDQEGVIQVTGHLEPLLNPDTAMSPDLYSYDAEPTRCSEPKLDGERCKGKKLPGRTMCVTHVRMESGDDES